jgi:ribosomal protein L10
MGKKYIEENIEKLRKQRDENIVGGYRDLVVKTYQHIQKQIKKSGSSFKNPKNSDISKSVYGNRNQENSIRGFIKDLKKSGYISVYGVGLDREIKILKDLDF